MTEERKWRRIKIDPRLIEILKASVYQILAYLIGHILKELIEKIQF
jgi:hypothetical protein